MADDLSLLFKIRGDAAGAKTATAETRAAVAQLKSSLGTEFNQIQNAGQKALAGIGDNLNTFVGARVPLIGGAFLRVTENLKGVGAETKKVDVDIAKFGKTIDGLSTSTGKSKSELVTFLTSFVQLESQASRDVAAVKFLGSAFDEKLIPQLEKAGTELSTVATSAGAAGSSIGAAVPIIGVAAVALIALHVAAVAIVQRFLELTVSTAEWQGKLHDTSQQTEVNVETLSGLEVALRKTGGSLDSATNALITFQTKLSDAQDPTTETSERFAALGITASDTETAFRQALLAVAAMPDGFEKVNTAAELFGRRGAKQLLAAIKETDGDLDKLIRQLKATGVLLESDVAKAADEFNDQLLVVQLQIRALTAELVTSAIPQILAALRATSKVIAENKDNIEIIGKAIGLFVEGNVRGVLLPALQAVATTLKIVEEAWKGVAGAAEVAMLVSAGVSAEEALKLVQARESAAARFKTGSEEESGLGGDLTQRREFRESQERLKQAKFEADEQARISRDAIAQAERDFQAGKSTRAQQTADVITNLKKQTEARLTALQVEEKTKQLEQASREGDPVAQRKIAEEIDKIRQESRNLQSETNNKVKEEEQKAQQDRAKATIDHLNNLISLRRKHAENEIAIVEARIKANEVAEETGAKQIADIQRRVFAERRKTLTDQGATALFGGLSQEQVDAIRQQIEELNLEQDRAEREQSERLKDIRRQVEADERESLLRRMETQLRLGSIRDNAQIASLRALAALRIRTEEETEKSVLAIRLAAKDREADAIRARLTAAGAISDPKSRAQEEQRLNDELRIILAERAVIVDQGARDAEAGRQRDIESLQRYRDAYRELLEETVEDERDIARLRIEMLRTSRASRSVILQAEFAEETAVANSRHAREIKRLRDEYDSALASSATMREKLAALQAYHAAVEAENERHALAEAERKEREKQEQLMAGPYGGLLSGLETGQLQELKDGIQSFQDVATVAFSAVGAAVNGLAQGIGGLVQNWVLLGATGPNAMKKLVASVLAGVAAQSAVLAIFELARGFAALFFNPAEAVAHFQAAALFGSIAVGTAIAGRAVAGDSFKTEAAGGSSSRESTQTTRRSNEPIDVNRRSSGGVNVTIQLQGDIATDALKTRVVDAMVDSINRDNDDRVTTAIQGVASRGR